MKFAREILRGVDGYVPGEQPRGGSIIKLNTNENPYPPSPRVVSALCDAAGDPERLRKYPDPVSEKFRAAYAERFGYPGPEWVMVGNGMDELLAMALRSFVDPGDRVLAGYPTYSLYEVLCALHGAAIHYVDLDAAFQLVDEFYETPARLCFLTRPNAPSGVSVPREAVARFCRTFKGLVVIDEAYADFGDDNCMDFPRELDNVIVMRTFSKSFSLAGMRIGTAVARPELISEFLKTKDSYNMDTLSQAAALAAIEDYEHMRANVARIRASRTWLRAELIRLGFKVPDSQSNFLLAHWEGEPGAKALFEALRAQGILVRYFDMRRLENALRITVGTGAECSALVSALEAVVQP